MPQRRSSRPHSVLLCLALLAVVLLSACRAAPTPGLPPTPTHLNNALPSWLKIYFTRPDLPKDAQTGVDRVVAAAIDGATQSVDVVSYEYDLPGVTEALVRAHQRGVQVRLVLDLDCGWQFADKAGPDKASAAALAAIQQAGLPLVNGSHKPGLMHNKFILVDGWRLFTGSWNLTYSDTYSNNNNLLEITSQRLIANYQAKFNELFVAQRYGSQARVGALTPALKLDGVQVENYFSPPDGVSAHLLQYIRAARQSIHFMSFTFTDQALAAAMVERARAGVAVRGVMDARNPGRGALRQFQCAGRPVRLDGNRYALHHKVIILDAATVITGSYNFTQAANEQNDENLLVIHDRAAAAQFLAEYARVEALGKAPDSSDLDCSVVK